MTRKDARVMVRRLALSDMSVRMAFRFAAWLATALAVWGVSLLLSVALLDSALRPSALSFHTVVMAAIGSLPAFLAYPFSSARALEAVRRADGEAAIESWLDYPGGPAERLLETRAREALSITALKGLAKPRPSKTASGMVAGLFALAAVSFLAAQIASIRSGCGVSLSYPVRRMPEITADRFDPYDDATLDLVVPDAVPEDERGAPGARRYAGVGAQEEDELAESAFPAADGALNEDPASASPSGEERAERRMDVATRGTGSGAGEAPSAGGHPTDTGGDAAGRDSAGEARAPGWEGSGRAIDASPLVDYRARFERQLAETSGRETILGDAPSAELVSEAVAEFYASFDARVAVGSTAHPGIARAEAAWREAFSPEAAE